MKGNISAFLANICILLFCCFISGEVCAAFFQPAYDSFCQGINLAVGKNLLCGVDEQDVHACRCGQSVREPSPTFAYPPFEQISFYRPLEQFLRDRNKYPVVFQTVIVCEDVSDRAVTAVPARGQKVFYVLLAAKPLLFRKSFCDLPVHFQLFFDR